MNAKKRNKVHTGKTELNAVKNVKNAPRGVLLCVAVNGACFEL